MKPAAQPSATSVPVSFPPGETDLGPMPFSEAVLAQVDERLAVGDLTEGRFEIVTREARLTCLIHRAAPYIAGLQERDVFSRVRLYDFVARSRQLDDATCSLVTTDLPLVLMTAIHFCKQPMLKGSTRLVDPAHVLQVLARDRRDAAIAFERSGRRTLLFLKDGSPARLYFGDSADDPGEGSLEERVLAFAFGPGGESCEVEVFTDLRLEADPDAGTALATLAESAKPPPPIDICVSYPDGRELRRRPFTEPEMIVGRDPKVDLFIDNLAVSRRHARITWERGSFVIEDLGSANGTFVGGTRATRVPIDADSKVEIGKFELSIFEYPTEPVAMETMFLPMKSLPAAGSLVGGKEPLDLDKDVLLGKSEGVDVPVRGLRVKPVHARLSCREGEFELSCFGSARARVNGEQVRSAKLAFGDEIRIGRSRFKLVRKAE